MLSNSLIILLFNTIVQIENTSYLYDRYSLNNTLFFKSLIYIYCSISNTTSNRVAKYIVNCTFRSIVFFSRKKGFFVFILFLLIRYIVKCLATEFDSLIYPPQKKGNTADVNTRGGTVDLPEHPRWSWVNGRFDLLNIESHCIYMWFVFSSFIFLSGR